MQEMALTYKTDKKTKENEIAATSWGGLAEFN